MCVRACVCVRVRACTFIAAWITYVTSFFLTLEQQLSQFEYHV